MKKRKYSFNKEAIEEVLNFLGPRFLILFQEGGFLFFWTKIATINLMEISQKQNPEGKPPASYGAGIFFLWVFWQFFEMPGNIFKAWRNFLRFNLNYFSIPLLLKTFFSPWRKYRWSYGKGFDIGRFFSVFFSNLIFRLFGAILRSFLIIIGFLTEFFIIFSGIIIFFSWLALPAILIWGLIFGIQVFF